MTERREMKRRVFKKQKYPKGGEKKNKAERAVKSAAVQRQASKGSGVYKCMPVE